MSLSIQTNVDSLVAQQNLRTNSAFQSRTIQQLTSGYRINSSGDDAAGLAIANTFRNNIAELTQGVRNANDGVAQLQIMDGGLSNISQILDRLKTLATESASTTFTGDRTTLNNEYQSLLLEVNRQAANVGLNSGGANNAIINVYIGGGGATQSNSQVSVDLSGTGNQVDANGLGVGSTNLLGAASVSNSTVNLNGVVGNLLTGAGATQTFTLQLAGGTSVTATVSSAGAGGITVANAVQQLSTQLSSHGVTASIDAATGHLAFSGSVAFEVVAGNSSAGTGLTNNGAVSINQADYSVAGAAPFTVVGAGNTEVMTFTSGGTSTTVTLDQNSGASAATAVAYLNTQLAGLGINAVIDNAGTGIDFLSANQFSYSQAVGSVAGVFAAGAIGNTAAAAPTTTGTSTGNSLSALTAITTAIGNLGLVQGRIGAGENKLGYSISLAQSQIANFSSAESQIRDADVAAQAANLTKAQVLQQASIAAMAQANSAPQAILSLLKG
jgi:flagellin